MNKLTEEEYQAELKQWFKEQGPNPGNGMFGKWSWHLHKEKEFREKLVREGKIDAVKKKGNLP